jgi:hypothetical protein
MSANFLKKVPLYVRLHEVSSHFFPHCSYMSACKTYISPIYTHKPSLYVRSRICLLHVCPYISAKFYIKPYIHIMSVCTNCPPNILHIVLQVRLHDISGPSPLTQTSAHLIELIKYFHALYIRDSYVFTLFETGGLPSKLASEIVTRRAYNFRFLLSRPHK